VGVALEELPPLAQQARGHVFDVDWMAGFNDQEKELVLKVRAASACRMKSCYLGQWCYVNYADARYCNTPPMRYHVAVLALCGCPLGVAMSQSGALLVGAGQPVRSCIDAGGWCC
jgi:hypothetical protein